MQQLMGQVSVTGLLQTASTLVGLERAAAAATQHTAGHVWTNSNHFASIDCVVVHLHCCSNKEKSLLSNSKCPSRSSSLLPLRCVVHM